MNPDTAFPDIAGHDTAVREGEAHTTVEITVRGGRIRGAVLGHVRRFLAVPYAQPVSGRWRFEPPRPAAGWQGIRDATSTGYTAPQPDRSRFGSLNVSPFFAPGWARGDDYLTMNIWAPVELREPAPVLVFVHGGGFVAGSASAPAYDGTAFARDGVIFVGINYRLGAPGFLAIPGTENNRGVLDVIEALRWIRENIAAFGGDPASVTIAGQSAGAVMVANVLCSPVADGLVQRAIMESGTGTGAFSPEQGEIVAREMSVKLETPITIDRMGAVSDDALVGAAASMSEVDVTTATTRAPIGGIVRFGPILPVQPAALVGNAWGRHVNLLIGTNLDEAGLYLAPTGALDDVTPQDVVVAAQRFVRDPELLIAEYRHEFPESTDAELVRSITGDGMFGAGSRAFADAHVSHTATTHVYEFSWRSDAAHGLLGASHLMELPFVFDRVGTAGMRGTDALLGSRQASADVADRVHSAWVWFVKGHGPGWQRYTATSPAVQDVGSSWSLLQRHRTDLYAAWTSADDPLSP